ncbi:MAG: riboflavin synthase [Lachnospiraceae bacterium]|jgi:riboflavin synthase, alpha subunit|nr:riboflavin synthase [Lachnospiraceae bacterium]
MFTGIIEEMGTVSSIAEGSLSAVITIQASKVLEGSQTGDSIAVNGVCLTVTSIHGSFFTADVMAETLRRSSLGSLSKGSHVNLERAMPMNGRFGGHIVSGHIDGTGTVVSKVKEDNAVWVKINASQDILKYIVLKGSVAIDGTSLTVAGLDDSTFSVSVIPHTASETILLQKSTGDIVNLENDIIGKYIERLLSFQNNNDYRDTGSSPVLTVDFLLENGF